MVSCLHTTGRALIQITPAGNKSLMTHIYRALTLYQISKCKPAYRVSNSRASTSICRSLHATSKYQQMKRKEPLSEGQASAAKRPRTRVEVPDYHATASHTDEVTGQPIWPAPEAQMKQARDIILDW